MKTKIIGKKKKKLCHADVKTQNFVRIHESQIRSTVKKKKKKKKKTEEKEPSDEEKQIEVEKEDRTGQKTEQKPPLNRTHESIETKRKTPRKPYTHRDWLEPSAPIPARPPSMGKTHCALAGLMTPQYSEHRSQSNISYTAAKPTSVLRAPPLRESVDKTQRLTPAS